MPEIVISTSEVPANLKQFYDNIERDDLNSDMQTLADQYGLELVKDLIFRFGGFSFYLVNPLTFCQKALNKTILELQDTGKTKKQIATQLGISIQFYNKIMETN